MLRYVPLSVTLKDNIKLNADWQKSYLIAKLQKNWINRNLTIDQLPVKDRIDLPREVTKHKSEWRFWDEYKWKICISGQKTKLNWNDLTLQKSYCGYCRLQFWAVALLISKYLSGEWFLKEGGCIAFGSEVRRWVDIAKKMYRWKKANLGVLWWQ